MVLLKNEEVLPFAKTGGKKIAVIGALADLENTGDQGSSNSAAPYVITPYQGIKDYQEGLGNEVLLHDGADLESAKELAETADEVVLVVGYTFEEEGEYLQMNQETMRKSAEAGQLVGKRALGGDREDLHLLDRDEKLIKTLAPLHQKLVVVYIGGSAIDMSAWEAEVPAILFAWYGGMEGGKALAHILYGEINPSGKLPFSIAQSVEDYPPFNPYTTSIDYGYYHGYTLLDRQGKKAAYPFGFGKSYTDFSVGEVSGEMADDKIIVRTKITNIGDRKGAEVIQAYVGFSNSAVDRPVKLLRAFAKVELQAGEQKDIAMDIDINDLAWYNPETKAWEVEDIIYELYVGTSSAEDDLYKTTFQLGVKEESPLE